MQSHSNMKTLGNNQSANVHSFVLKSEDNWKSPMKIMLSFSFNVISNAGINNLWKQKSAISKWIGIGIAVIILCTILPVSEARPAAGASRSLRDSSRHFFASSTTGYVAAKSTDMNSNSGDTLSLSIFSPLDILRQNMLLEIQRKRIRHAKHRQMQSNKEFLDRIGR